MSDSTGSHEDLVRENQRLKSLVELSAHLAGAQGGLGEKLQNCVEVLAGLTNAEKVSLLLLEGDALVVKAASNSGLIGMRTSLEEHTISTDVVKRKAPVYTKAVEDSGYHEVSRQGDVSSYRTGSLISLPLMVKDQVVGVLNLSDKQGASYFDETDLEMAQGIAGQVADQVNFSALHSRLNKAFLDLEASQRAKDDLMYMVFHDMKAPITGVKEILNLMADPAPVSGLESGQLLDLAQSDLELLWRRISNLLDISRMDGGDMPVNPVPLDLAALAKETVGRLMGICRLNQVGIEFDFQGQADARIDEDLVERILVNLLVNAIRASSPEQGGEGRVKLSLDLKDGNAVFLTADSGQGVDPALGDEIFERFAQGRHSKGSSGIGLYFCQRAAGLLGGEVSYQNAGTGGAVFKLRLPLAEG